MERPNLLYIFTDQQSAHMMSCTGNPHLRTPAMDRLAAQGTRFERAYCAQPLCGPSRTAMQTGVYPHQAGVPFNFREDECTCRPMPRLGGLLRDAGYDTGYIGKWHLCDWPRDTAVHGYDTVYLGETPRRDDSLPPFCDAFFRRRRDRPFAAVVSFVNPHDICQAARDQDFPNGNVGPLPPPEECPPLPANFAVAADEPELLQRVRARGGAYRWTQGWDEGRWRQYGWAYMRLTEKVDALVGRVLNSLAEAGHADDTVVVFSSDHGDGGGSHHWNQKQCLYEEAIRVPLIVMDPRGPRVARVDATRPVNNGLDLLPTLCDYAGTPPPAGRMGRSLRPLVEGREVESRDHTVVETVFGVHSHPSDDQGRALISRDWKYVVYNQGARREQLFRIREDPGEQDNRAADETCAATLGRHRELMRAWCRETDDQFPVPE